MRIFAFSLCCLLIGGGFVLYKHQTATATCVACESLTGVEKVVCLADAFKGTLSTSQIATLQLDYNLTNAKKWSNLPVTFVARLGIRLGDLNTEQLAAAKALIAAATGETSPEGYAEIEGLWAADQYLSQNGGGSSYGSGQYYLAFLGEPSTTGTWELQTGGHHLAVSNTYANGALTGATPSFRAIEPFAAFTLNGTSYQPIKEERDALAAALASLSTSELATAKLSGTFSDILLGPNKDWQFPTTKSGIQLSQLSTAQKDLVLAAIRTYVDDIDSVNAAAYLDLYESQLNDTYLAYSGNAALTAQNGYVRIDGPRVWIEYSVQNGIILTPTHPHSVWRDHQSDYGGLGNPSATTSVAFTGKYTLSPNPASDVTQVNLELPESATVRLNVFDSTGRKIEGGLQLNVTAGQHNLPLSVAQWPAGLYNCVLQVQTGSGIQVATRTLSKF